MAWTAPKTWSVGEVVTAANMNIHLRDNLLAVGPHLIARKPSDETVTSSTVFQADDHLLAPVGVNEVWWLQWVFIATGATAGDMKVQWTFPSAGFVSWQTIGFNDAGTLTNSEQGIGTSPTSQFTLFLLGATTPIVRTVDMFYTGGANAGNVAAEWAQVTSSGTATTMRANSALWGMKLA